MTATGFYDGRVHDDSDPPRLYFYKAPSWAEKDALNTFLYWHGTRKNLRRILKFVSGKPRREVNEIKFMEADFARARIDSRTRQVTFFSPDEETLPKSVVDFDELTDRFEGYIQLDGFPDRSPSAE